MERRISTESVWGTVNTMISANKKEDDHMVNKPITVARNDYMAALCNITNQSNLPAFVVVDVLTRFTAELEKLAEAELSRDTAAYREAIQKAREGDQRQSEPSQEQDDATCQQDKDEARA